MWVGECVGKGERKQSSGWRDRHVHGGGSRMWRRFLVWIGLTRDRTSGVDAPIDLGVWGEGQAADRLRRDGWKILGRRVRPNRRDELDIIAARDGVLAFVEVKTRTDERVARPGASVNAAKRHALNRAARAYLRQAGFPERIYRFDIVEVVGRPDGTRPEIRHHEDAFSFERMTWR